MRILKRAFLFLVVVSAAGFAGPRSFAWAQETAVPSVPHTAAARMLDQMVAAGAARSAAVTGKIAALSGSVKVRRVKALFWENAEAGQQVAQGDSVRTGKDGQAKIAFGDGNFLFVKKNSVVIIDALARDEASGKYDAAVKATKARLKLQIDNKESLHSFEIRTPVVVCGVRGTILYVNARPGFADVFVERGDAFVRSPISGEERELPAGLATQTDRLGQIADPLPPPPEQLAEMQEGWEPLPPPPPPGGTMTDGTAPPPPGGTTTQTAPPPPEGTTTDTTLLLSPINLADVAPPPNQQQYDLLDRTLTQQSTLTDYISNPPSDPLALDSDNDGLTDWEELKMQMTNPLVTDTDADGNADLNDAFPNDPGIYLESRQTIRDARYDKMATIAGLRAEITSMLADGYERQHDYLMDKISDAQMQKVMKDHAGNWVRLEQYVFRPTPNTIEVAALTYRTSNQLTYFHWETTFNTSLTGLSSQQIKNLPWEKYLNAVPSYGATAPALYPTKMEVDFENGSNGQIMTDRRTFYAPAFGGSWTQSTSEDVSFNLSAFYAVSLGGSTAGNPASFQYTSGGGNALFNVYVISDAGSLAGGPYTFDTFWTVLACNLPGFTSVGNSTVEIAVTFGGNTWSYLYLPIRGLLWRGSTEWQEQLTW
ncbi:MAG: FecR domain-containing protein [Deltaproteobacteria bacterium]